MQKILIVFMCFAGVNIMEAVGTQFLNVPSSVNEIVYDTQNPNAEFPLHQFGKTSLSVSHNDWYGGFSVASAKLSRPIWDGQSLIKFKYGGFENLELRGEKPTDDPLGIYSAFGFELLAGFYKKYLNYECTALIKSLHFRIHTHSSSGFSGSFALLKPLASHWKLGFSLSHFGIMSPFLTEKQKLPFSGSLLVTKQKSFDNIENSFSFSGGYIPVSEDFIVSISNVISWKSIHIFFASKVTQNVSHVSAGFSVYLGMYQIQYGFQVADHKLGNSQILGFSVNLP